MEVGKKLIYLRLIDDLGRRPFPMRVRPEITGSQLKLMIDILAFRIPMDQQQLAHMGQFLRDDQTMMSYGVQHGHVIYVVRRSARTLSAASARIVAPALAPVGANSTSDIISGIGSSHSQEFGGSISALFPTLEGGLYETIPGVLLTVRYVNERFNIKVWPELTILEVKGLITQHQDIVVNEQRLIYSGQFLHDRQTIGSYGVQDGHVIDLVRRIVPATSAASTDMTSLTQGFVNIPNFPGFANPPTEEQYMASLADLLRLTPRCVCGRTGQTAGGAAGNVDGQITEATATPEELYSNHVILLRNLGFKDIHENMEALRMTHDDLRSTVQLLLLIKGHMDTIYLPL